MEEPWFTYFRGRGKMQISPRNGKGWVALGMFVLLVTGVSLLLGPMIERSLWMLVPYLTLVALLTVGFIRFAITKSQRIDIDVDPAELEEFKAWKRRGKR